MLTALRGDQPDRVPLPLRMWKFLRKYYSDTGDPLDKALRANDEFGIDLWHYALSPILPCFSPTSLPRRDDISVETNHEVRDNRNIWERTINIPEGQLHDVKQAPIIKQGSGSGSEIVEPLVKDFGRDMLKPANFLMLYHDDREEFRKIVNIGAEAMMDETSCILEAGFNMLQTWWFYASPSYG